MKEQCACLPVETELWTHIGKLMGNKKGDSVNRPTYRIY